MLNQVEHLDVNNYNNLFGVVLFKVKIFKIQDLRTLVSCHSLCIRRNHTTEADTFYTTQRGEIRQLKYVWRHSTIQKL